MSRSWMVVALAMVWMTGGIALALETDREVFPGAVGFGVTTPAGRGGQVVRVTTLAAEGPGSLREAVATKGPRIIVFEVGGVIDLGKRTLKIAEPHVTIAGQTAPAPGITIIRGGVSIQTHDVLLQHLRVRPGDAGSPRKSGWEPDGIATEGPEAHHIVVDHCSITWSVDENLSASGPRLEGPHATSRDITFRHCLIAEALHDASHAKGPHSKGTLIHDHCTNIAIIGNLYAHNVDRNPLFKGGCTGVVVNNLVYNPGVAAINSNYVDSEYAGATTRPANSKVAIVGNVMLHGSDTRKGLPLVTGSGRGDLYLEDNLALDRAGQPVALVTAKYTMLKEKPLWPKGLIARPASEVKEWVLASAGARPAERDAIDRRIVQSVRDGQGKVIHSQDEVGGYPKVEPVTRKLDVPARDVEAWLARLAQEVETAKAGDAGRPDKPR